MVSEFWSAIILAVVQGITEWFPVSSDGHLVLFTKLLGFEGGLDFDVALHFGTLMAVFVYFGRDIVDIIRDLLYGKWSTPNGKLGLYIAVSTIPAVIIGFTFKKYFELSFTSLGITAMGFAVTGIFLLICSMPYKRGSLTYGKSFLIGIAQAFALFPGVSRSATTIGTGLLTGLDEKSAMKFSFLMSIPVIFGANLYVLGNNSLPPSLIIPTLVSFAVGILAIYLLYGKILNSRKNLRWFAAYTLLLAAALGIWILFR